jgi:hypothetical protein
MPPDFPWTQRIDAGDTLLGAIVVATIWLAFYMGMIMGALRPHVFLAILAILAAH